MSEHSSADSHQPSPANSHLQIQALPYLLAIRDHLKTEHVELWNWFKLSKTQDQYAEEIRFQLLKSTYRIDHETEAGLYQRANSIASQIGLAEIPITIYQAQNPAGINATICSMRNEAHIVFHGPITEQFDNSEVDSILAHELGHLLLWREWGQEFLVTELILAALTNDVQATPVHFETARLFQLFVEVFCDRVALACVDDRLQVISTLVKISTDLKKVNPKSYLKQAREVMSQKTVASDGITHPETFIRALAVDQWANAVTDAQRAAADDQINQHLRGSLSLTTDLLGQQTLQTMTRQLIDEMLRPKWMQSELNLAHASSFFDNYAPPSDDPSAPSSTLDLFGQLEKENVRKYFAYLMLDFVAADRDLELAPLAWAMVVAETIGLRDLLIEIARKELRLRKKQIEKIESQREQIINDAQEQFERTTADTNTG
ncbi:MAG: M48 family metalloprotease [Planctomycetota bacterium]